MSLLHVRRHVRDAAYAALATALPAFTALKANQRAKDATVLPAFKVFTRREAVQPVMVAGNGIDRQIDLRVVLSLLGTDDLDDLLDQNSALAEAAIMSDAPLAAIARSVDYIGAEISDDASGAKRLGHIEIAFDVVVMTPEGDPTVIEI
jgi:hypothetical protein